MFGTAGKTPLGMPTSRITVLVPEPWMSSRFQHPAGVYPGLRHLASRHPWERLLELWMPGFMDQPGLLGGIWGVNQQMSDSLSPFQMFLKFEGKR